MFSAARPPTLANALYLYTAAAAHKPLEQENASTVFLCAAARYTNVTLQCQSAFSQAENLCLINVNSFFSDVLSMLRLLCAAILYVCGPYTCVRRTDKCTFLI